MEQLKRLYALLEAEIENYQELANLANQQEHEEAEKYAANYVEVLKHVLQLIESMYQ